MSNVVPFPINSTKRTALASNMADKTEFQLTDEAFERVTDEINNPEHNPALQRLLGREKRFTPPKGR
ncbi:hypothetical protein ACYPKM_02445 [Pseudomonas aeruginosa]